MKRPSFPRAAYTLVELVFVLAIISVLASLLLPVFHTARGAARQISCASNLRQIGHGFAQYLQDNDGYYPITIGPGDRFAADYWRTRVPEFGNAIPQLPLVAEVLQPYTHSPALFECRADTGFEYAEWSIGWFTRLRMDAFPTCYQKFGMSYFYRSSISAIRAHESTIQRPAQIALLSDADGRWHGTLSPLASRYNTLFADGHVKNLDIHTLDEAWSTPVNAP